MKRLLAILKFVIPAAIVVWLIVTVQRHDPQTFSSLAERPKHWGLLALALGLMLAASVATFVRWHLLVRTLDMPFALSDALRLGFLGYLLHFVSAGSVGGDLFKAIFIARGQPGRRAEAVATVIADRILGLYALLIVTSLGILFDTSPANAEILAIRRGTLIATGVALASVLVLLLPGFTTGPISEMLTGLPKVGSTIRQIISAIRLYRRRPGMLTLLTLLSVAVHLTFAGSVYLIGQALYPSGPSLVEHLVIVPLSMLCGALPLAPAGLGAFELAMKYLFQFSGEAAEGQGLVIALAYRVGTIAIAMIGVVYYWMSRREMSELLHQAEVEAERQQHAAPETVA